MSSVQLTLPLYILLLFDVHSVGAVAVNTADAMLPQQGTNTDITANASSQTEAVQYDAMLGTTTQLLFHKRQDAVHMLRVNASLDRSIMCKYQQYRSEADATACSHQSICTHVSPYCTTDDGFEAQCYSSDSDDDTHANTSAYVRMHLQASAQRNSPSLQPSKHVDTNEPVTTQ
eukprot:8138-Heterococcus_DN1.PRE.4